MADRGRSPTRYSEPVGCALSSDVWDWPAIEERADVRLSAEARHRIEWAESTYRMVAGFETIKRTEFTRAAARALVDVRLLQEQVGAVPTWRPASRAHSSEAWDWPADDEREDTKNRNAAGEKLTKAAVARLERLKGRVRETPFGAAMRAALVASGSERQGWEWDECLASLDRMAELLSRAPAAPEQLTRKEKLPAASVARERYILEIARAMQADGQSAAAHVSEDGSSSPLVRLLQALDLQKGAGASSFVREIQKATKPLRKPG
ncbi:MAG TPA: hypothetical protein VMM55_11145 [Thermohalobaculum sp.]|nr:hypothetical protein [Thermohalobaculum sp.]